MPFLLQASKGAMTCVSQEVKELCNMLEHEFLPLDLTSKVQPLLSKISKIGGKLSSASSLPEVQLLQYIPALEKLTTMRVLLHVFYFSEFWQYIYLGKTARLNNCSGFIFMLAL